MFGSQWWSVVGAAVWTAGGVIQAYRELAAFERFYESVLATHERLVDEQTRSLIASTKLWQFWRRSAIRKAVKREGWELLNDEEKSIRRDIDLRALGWLVVSTGGLITTASAAAAAIGS